MPPRANGACKQLDDRFVHGERKHRAALGLRVGSENRRHVFGGELTEEFDRNLCFRLIVEELELNRLPFDPAGCVCDVLIDLQHPLQLLAEIGVWPAQRIDDVDDIRIRLSHPDRWKQSGNERKGEKKRSSPESRPTV